MSDMETPMNTVRWAAAAVVAGLALAVLALSEPMQTCRQVLSDVVVCTYTVINYVVVVVGVVVATAGAVVGLRELKGRRSNG